MGRGDPNRLLRPSCSSCVDLSMSLVPSSSSVRGGERINCGLIPYDLGVMIIDEDPTSLLLMQTMLKTCNYRVATFDSAREALYALWKRQGEFDLVITEIHMDSMNGFNLLHRIVTQLDVPVITMCSDDDPQLQREAIINGACFHLVKPINMAKMEVVLHKGWRNKGDNMIEQVGGENLNRKKRNGNNANIVNDNVKHEHKRPRLQWNRELHHRFLVAVRLLGDDVIPTKIINVMNIEGLTNKQISSHLQKYRKRLAKLKQMDEKEKSECLVKEDAAPAAGYGTKKKKQQPSTKKKAAKQRKREGPVVLQEPSTQQPIENSNANQLQEAKNKNNAEKAPAAAALDGADDGDWPGLDDFLGLNDKQPIADNNENTVAAAAAAGEGTSATTIGEGTSATAISPFDVNFDIEYFDLDDDFLDQIINDGK